MTLWVNKEQWAVVLPERSAMLNIHGAKTVLTSRGFMLVGFVGGPLDLTDGKHLIKIETNEDIEKFKEKFEVTTEYRLKRLERLVNKLKKGNS